MSKWPAAAPPGQASPAEASEPQAGDEAAEAGEPIGLPAPQLADDADLMALQQALESWLSRLRAAGLPCRSAAVMAATSALLVEFAAPSVELRQAWGDAARRVLAGEGAVVSNLAEQPGSDQLVAAPLQLPDGQSGVVGVLLAPPHADRQVQVLLLSLGWLQLALAAARIERSQRAARLLEQLGHVASQSGSRAAAQEWINRTAAWSREVGAQQEQPRFTLALFDIRGGLPHWWVAADTAWAERASPEIQLAQELAMQAMVQMQDVADAQGWATPALAEGEVVAVLVARFESPGAGTMPEPAAAVLRASLGLCEPLLRRWHQADRPLWRHHVESAISAWRKIRGPGHLVWKVGAAGVVVALATLLVWPVPDRVNASTVIEGRIRQVVTAPFDGFLAQVKVRPGQQVVRGQVLARLDDRDLRLDQSKARSEHDQASAKLRQAMADRDAPAMALALAEVQQADAQLALVEAKLARADLIAPLDGLLVTGDWVQQIGSPVETGKEMFEIAAGSGYRVVLHVPDRDIARVRIGQTGALRLTGQPHVAHEFRVSNVTASASVQEGVNGFRVEAEWVGEAPPLSPGMQGVGKVEVGRSNLLTIWTRSSIDWLRLKLWAWWW